MSIRRACRVLEVDTSTYHYRSRRPDQAGLEGRIRGICATRVRYGYRRVHVLLRREGWRVNHERTCRIYRELGLQLRNKTPTRRVKAKLREDCRPASQANETWAMDFIHDQLATGRKIRVLTVVDTFSRYAPVIDPRFSYRAEDVVAALEQACAVLGYPQTIRVDQGTEFVSRDLDLWAYAKGVTLDFSRPGKPTDTDVIEKLIFASGAFCHGVAVLRRGSGPPMRGEPTVCQLCNLHRLPFGGPPAGDVVVVSCTSPCMVGWQSGAQLERSLLARQQGRPDPDVVRLLGQHVPDDHRQLAGG